MTKTKLIPIATENHKTIYSYYHNDKNYLVEEYRFKGLKLKCLKPSKNRLRKEKRYKKPINRTLLNSNTSITNTKQHYKKQQQHFKTRLFNNPIVFNNGFMGNMNLSKDGSQKLGLLIERIITK